MKPFAAFLKMQLNVNYSVSALKYRFTREKKKLWEPILIGAVIILSLLPMLAIYTGLMLTIFTAGSMVNQPEMVLAFSFMFAQIVILVFGLFYIMGTFYFSKDLESFVPLPLRPYEVVGGKFAVIMVNEYLTSMPILLPPIIIFGVGTSQGLIYWLESLVMMLVIPVLPLTAAALVIMVLMRVINLRRYKDFLAIVGGIIALFLGIGFSMFMQKIPEDVSQIQQYFTSQSGLVEMIGRRFPPVIWATKGLSEGGLEGLGYMLLFMAVCIILFISLLWLSNQIFYKALLAGQEVSRKKKNLTAVQRDKQYGKMANPVLAMMSREWKLLARTPIYVLNGLTGAFIGPIIFATMFFVRGSDPQISTLFNEIHNPDILPYVLLGGLGLMLFTAGMNLVASTSLSREGQTIWIAKMIPVTAKQQVNAKLIISFIISAVGVIVTGLIMLFFLKLPLLWVLGIIILGLLGSVPMVAVNLALDIFHPKLIWNSEQEAMKQNMNGGIGMLLSIIVIILLGAITTALLLMELPMLLVFFAIGVASVILGVLSLLLLYAVAERKYCELEA